MYRKKGSLSSHTHLIQAGQGLTPAQRPAWVSAASAASAGAMDFLRPRQEYPTALSQAISDPKVWLCGTVASCYGVKCSDKVRARQDAYHRHGLANWTIFFYRLVYSTRFRITNKYVTCDMCHNCSIWRCISIRDTQQRFWSTSPLGDWFFRIWSHCSFHASVLQAINQVLMGEPPTKRLPGIDMRTTGAQTFEAERLLPCHLPAGDCHHLSACHCAGSSDRTTSPTRSRSYTASAR